MGRRFAELPRWYRTLVTIGGAVQVALFVAAQVDLSRRPSGQVRGSKTRWRWLTLLNFIGPLCYFRWGRRPATDPVETSPD